MFLGSETKNQSQMDGMSKHKQETTIYLKFEDFNGWKYPATFQRDNLSVMSLFEEVDRILTCPLACNKPAAEWKKLTGSRIAWSTVAKSGIIRHVAGDPS